MVGLKFWHIRTRSDTLTGLKLDYGRIEIFGRDLVSQEEYGVETGLW